MYTGPSPLRGCPWVRRNEVGVWGSRGAPSMNPEILTVRCHWHTINRGKENGEVPTKPGAIGERKISIRDGEMGVQEGRRWEELCQLHCALW
jgi:hypothetical protein